MTRLHLVRHGPTHAKAMIGWTDLPADLSDRAALNRLDAHLPIAPVVSSDLGRAISTADWLSATRPRLPHHPGFREIHFGQWEGQTFATAEAENPALIRAYWDNPGTIAPPGGESWNDLATRVWAALDRHMHHHELIIVAHFGAILAILQRALGISAGAALGHHIDTLSVTDLAWDGTVWTVGQISYRP